MKIFWKKQGSLFQTLKTVGVVAASLLLFSVPSFSADRVVGANATLDIEPGARAAALGSADMARNPYQLSSARYAWASFSHTAYYEGTYYDFASAQIPLGEGQGLEVAFSRFGADDIPWIQDGEPIPEGSDYRTLSIADWVFSVSWGRRITQRVDLGIAFYGLYREMDQTGWGFRGDAGIRYRAWDQLYLSGLLKGWTSSATTWESGEVEYSSPEVYLGASYSLPVKYLYGNFNFYWQSAGLFHHEARALDFETDEDVGGRLWDDPVDWLSGGRGGVEFSFDFGLSLRAGLSSFTTLQSVTAGAGLVIANFLKVDYAFESHPVLSPVHRVSISVSPYLFSHAPKPEEGHLSVYEASREQESVEDSEDAGKPLVEEKGEEVAEPGPAQNSDEKSQPGQPEKDPAKNSPAVENDEEILELSPAGGTYWEE